ncbi:cytoplasmic tRNA 2-thiolation protein 2-A-like [Artemia franciscana]|uniref:Cytoplasmic tRNA 2-thiolation protein 2 n=1 Tax=Artemia franciscana TaxID=6661 RepID=A0AA88HK27_ARTSF|nr:hypothetical protein QYM36_014601 [Artemia franciscana]
MCSSFETEEFKALLQRPKTDGDTGQCKRCPNAGSILLRGYDSYCKDCFVVYVNHKFCSTIGKMRAVRHGDKVLIAFSGGISSSAMVHLVRESIERAGSQRRLVFQPTVFLILEKSVSSCYGSEEDCVSTAARFCQNYDLPFAWCHLDEYFNESPQFYTKVEDFQPSGRQAQLKELFKKVNSLTAKEDLLKRTRTELLIRVAKLMDHRKIFVGSNSSRIAADLLTFVAQGRGSQLPFEIGFSDTHDPDVTIIRPMREILQDEVEKYVEVKEIEVLEAFAQPEVMSRLSSIGTLTQDFLSSLQKDFPGTVPTVFRTGDKLTTAVKQDGEKCSFCKMPLDSTVIPPSSALQARLYSSALSTLGKSASQELIERFVVSKPEKDFSLIDCSHLCYGCSLTIKDCT